MNFWRRATIYSPILVRLLARIPHGRPLTDLEISRAGGLGVWEVAALCHCPSWTGITLDTMQKFLKGCGVDFCDLKQMKRVDAYRRDQSRLWGLGRSTWRYLKRDPHWETKYKPMFIAYLEHLNLPKPPKKEPEVVYD